MMIKSSSAIVACGVAREFEVCKFEQKDSFKAPTSPETHFNNRRHSPLVNLLPFPCVFPGVPPSSGFAIFAFFGVLGEDPPSFLLLDALFGVFFGVEGLGVEDKGGVDGCHSIGSSDRVGDALRLGGILVLTKSAAMYEYALRFMRGYVGLRRAS